MTLTFFCFLQFRVDNFSPKKSPSECGNVLSNSDIKYMDIEYIFEEPAKEIPNCSEKKSIIHYSEHPLLKDEAIVPHAIVTNCYEQISSYEESILPDSPPLAEHSRKYIYFF